MSVRRGALTVAACLALAGQATAHVTVLPETIPKEQGTAITIRVPTEGDSPTVSVDVNFPRGLSVYSFEPAPGWKVTPKRAADGRITGVRYNGGSIPAEGYRDFHVLAVGVTDGVGTWPTVQTFANGKLKAWTGPPEKPGTPETEGAAGPAAQTTVGPVAGVAAAATAKTSRTGIWLGVTAIGLAAVSALLAGLAWSSRPMRLPEDPPAS